MHLKQTNAQPEATSSVRLSFFNRVSRRLKSYKLGDLLVSGGLISQEQLSYALAQQKADGGRLGQILVRQGAISTVQLYHQLAEQWVMKAAAAGITLIMMSAPARAETPRLSGDFQVASAATTARDIAPARAQIAFPRLFGYQEVRSDNIQPFNKWTDVIQRFETQARSPNAAPRMQMWQAALQSFKSLPVEEQVRAVNDYVNQVRYVEDSVNWGKSDYWATPIEFFSRGGDCEDYAIAKYASLRALGFSTDQLRIAVVQDKIKNIPHAVLIVYTEEGTYVLDNQNRRAEQVQNVTRYKPVYSINSSSWWLHKS